MASWHRSFRVVAAVAVIVAVAAVAFAAPAGNAAPAAATACPSLANVTGFTGSARLTFAASASGKNQDNGDHLSIELDREATNLALDMTRKVAGGTLVSFIGHAHGGHIAVHDRSSETYSDETPRYTGTETYSGPLYATFGSAELIVDLTTCTYKLHVAFVVTTDYSGSKEVKPDKQVGGAFWTAREKLPTSLTDHSADGPDVYNHGCAGGLNILMSPDACYTPSGGWTDDFVDLALCHEPGQANCDVSSQRKIGEAQITWALKPLRATTKP